MMGYLLSVKMYYSDHKYEFAELLNITGDPSELNTICSKDYTLDEIIYHILSFEIV